MAGGVSHGCPASILLMTWSVQSVEMQLARAKERRPVIRCDRKQQNEVSGQATREAGKCDCKASFFCLLCLLAYLSV